MSDKDEPNKSEPSPASSHRKAWLKHLLPSPAAAEKAKVFRELEQKFPNQPETARLAQAIWLTGRGQLYAKRGRLFKALDCFAEAMSIKRDHIPAYLSMAIAFRRLGQFGGSYSYISVAMDTLKRLPWRIRLLGCEINLELFGASVYSEWATLYILTGNRTKAVECLEKALTYHARALDSSEQERAFLLQSGCRLDPEFALNLRNTLNSLTR